MNYPFPKHPLGSLNDGIDGISALYMLRVRCAAAVPSFGQSEICVIYDILQLSPFRFVNLLKYLYLVEKGEKQPEEVASWIGYPQA